MRKPILVLASRSKDYIYTDFEKKPTVKEGGPALFIRKVFDDLGVSYRLAQTDRAEVEIKISNQEEVGRILKPDRIKLPRTIIESNILISTIGPRALSLDFLKEYNGDVFLDIQGFVRCERSPRPGAKKVWKIADTIVNKLTVLKGTSEELHFLSPDVLERLKDRILIETRGAAGVAIWEAGKKTELAPPRKVRTENTIGAGDVFMAAFVYKFIKTRNARKSAYFALKYTSSFLENKEWP